MDNLFVTNTSLFSITIFLLLQIWMHNEPIPPSYLTCTSCGNQLTFLLQVCSFYILHLMCYACFILKYAPFVQYEHTTDRVLYLFTCSHQSCIEKGKYVRFSFYYLFFHFISFSVFVFSAPRMQMQTNI